MGWEETATSTTVTVEERFACGRLSERHATTTLRYAAGMLALLRAALGMVRVFSLVPARSSATSGRSAEAAVFAQLLSGRRRDTWLHSRTRACLPVWPIRKKTGCTVPWRAGLDKENVQLVRASISLGVAIGSICCVLNGVENKQQVSP